jgi:hypothetical protein
MRARTRFECTSLGESGADRVNVLHEDPFGRIWIGTDMDLTVRFFNRQGRVVQQRTLQVAHGVTASIEVAATDDLPVDRLGRRTFRAEIVGFNPQPDPPGKYTATLEVYSLITGHTTLFIGNPDTLPAATIVRPPGASN